MKVEKEKFDSLLQRLLRQKPEKTQAIKGTPKRREPIIPKPQSSEPR
jgi:exopolyphosphatase/pppGpp-phosphohydrolase